MIGIAGSDIYQDPQLLHNLMTKNVRVWFSLSQSLCLSWQGKAGIVKNIQTAAVGIDILTPNIQICLLKILRIELEHLFSKVSLCQSDKNKLELQRVDHKDMIGGVGGVGSIVTWQIND